MKERLPAEAWPFLIAMRGGRDAAVVRALAQELEVHPALAGARREQVGELHPFRPCTPRPPAPTAPRPQHARRRPRAPAL
jgi:hypothetical protein